ncbi:Chemotaxis regulator - transmits chemoreceptor signals to flagelllar motor components CheY [Grimontia indica]|uniref:Chemotaxis regulator - transmits chemoreceptor signals to flagelllar motor components CheY n=1 Tax=Grimontia indica TaxID=1056512 RepID=R1IH35_9GAMM|nr:MULTISPECIES: response regulator [Grimontia]EOD80011.1 Chemotaxis regulator - transmits chemoreceptor signals to flagelllar motor components CheY [Grimontia indica]
MKILVVDDMTSMRHVMLNLLRSIGYLDLEEATNGWQAFQMLQKTPYDLLITDLNMPKMDGRELLQEVRGNEKLAKTPVLIVSCEQDKDKVKELIQHGVNGFVVKPFNGVTLQKQINRIERQQTMQKEKTDEKKSWINGE